MKLINKILPVFLLLTPLVKAQPQIILEVEFEGEDEEESTETVQETTQTVTQDDETESVTTTEVTQSMITFGFSPGIFPRVIPLNQVQARENATPVMNAQEAIRLRKKIISDSRLYTFHMEKHQNKHTTSYLLTITTIL